MLDNWDEGAAAHADRIAAWLARAEALRDQALTKGESADVPFLQGRLAELTGAAASAAASGSHRDGTVHHCDLAAT